MKSTDGRISADFLVAPLCGHILQQKLILHWLLERTNLGLVLNQLQTESIPSWMGCLNMK
jgi:hypothetical protein